MKKGRIMNPLDEFRGLYPLSRTLKFRLIPRWETLERLQESDIIGEESRLRGHCDELKEAVDVLHRRLIEESLAGIDLDWQSLAEAAGGSSAVGSVVGSTVGSVPGSASKSTASTGSASKSVAGTGSASRTLSAVAPALENSVYQGFERALVNKLQYLCTKDDVSVGYQLTSNSVALENLRGQQGFLFFLNPRSLDEATAIAVASFPSSSSASLESPSLAASPASYTPSASQKSPASNASPPSIASPETSEIPDSAEFSESLSLALSALSALTALT